MSSDSHAGVVEVAPHGEHPLGLFFHSTELYFTVPCRAVLHYCTALHSAVRRSSNGEFTKQGWSRTATAWPPNNLLDLEVLYT